MTKGSEAEKTQQFKAISYSVPDSMCSEFLVSSLLDLLPCVVFTFLLTGDRLAVMPYASEKLVDLAGLSPQDAEKNAARFLNRIHPDDIEAFYASADASSQNLSCWNQEFRLNHPDAGIVWIQWRAMPVGQKGDRFWQGVMIDVTEQKSMDERLHCSEQAYRRLLENLPDNVARWDAEGRYLYLNPTLENTLNVSSEEILGKSHTEFLHRTCSGKEDAFSKILETGEPQVLQRVSIPDAKGDEQLHDVKLVPELDEAGQVISVLGLGRDMTGYYQALDAIVAKERELRLLHQAFDAAADNIYIVEESGRFSWVNRTACRVLGYSRDELVGMTPLDIDPDLTPEQMKQIVEVSVKGESYCLERRHRTRDGRTFPVEVVFDVFELDGISYSVTIARDISERKKEEQAYRSLAESSPDFVIRVDLDRRVRYVNARLLRELNMPTAAWVNGRRLTEVWPDGRYDTVEEAAERVVETEEEAIIELPLAKDDGSIVYHQVRIVPERDPDGHLIGTLAFGRDVTSIRESERRLRHVVDNLPGVAFTFRLSAEGQGSFPYLSLRAEKNYAIKSGESLGDMEIFHDRVHPEDQPRIEAAITESAHNLTLLNEEFRVRRPDGRERWIEARSVPEKQIDGSILWTGIMLDISERKRADLAYRSLADSSPDLVIRYDLEGRMRYLNSHMASYLQLSSVDEVVGLRPIEIWPDGRFNPVVNACADAVETGEKVVFSLEVIEGDGSFSCHHVCAVPERDIEGQIIGAIVFGRDVASIRENERRLQYIADNLPGVAYTFQVSADGQGSFPFLSEAVEDIYGLRPEDARNDMAPLHNLAHPEDKPRIEAAIAESTRNLTRLDFEYRILRADRQERWVEVRSTPERQIDGSTIWTGIMLDITERKQADLAYRSLADSSPDAVIRYDIEHRMRYLNNKLMLKLNISSMDEVIGKRPIEVWPDGRYSAIDDAAQQAIETGDEVIADLTSINDDGSLGYHRISVVPERGSDGRIIGTLAFGRDVTDIRENERRLQRYFDTLPGIAGIFRMSPDGHLSFPFLSQAVKEIYGLNPEEVREDMAPLHNMAHPDDRSRIEAAIAESAQYLTLLNFEYRVCRPDHPERWIEVRSEPERQSDGSTLWTGIMLDITERKRAEHQALLFRQAVDVSTDGVFVIDDQFGFVDVNRAACRSLGYSREELLGMTVLDINPDVTLETLGQMGEIVNELGQLDVFEARHRARDGRIFPVEISSTIFHEGSSRYSIAIVRDISGRKQVEHQMERLQRAVDASADSVFIIDDQYRFVGVNPAACNTLGYSREELLGMTPADINPDVTLDGLRQFGEAARKRKPIPTFEARHRAKDGRIIPVEIASDVFYEDGRHYYISMVRDITERKEADEQLKKAHDFAAKLLNAIPDPVFAKDPQHRWIMVNDAFCSVLGKPRELVVGKSDPDYLSVDEAESFWQKDDFVFSTGRDVVHDAVFTDVHGERHFIQTKKTLVEADILVGVIRDMTQERVAQEELRTGEEKLRSLYELSPMGIALSDMQGRYHEFNQAFCEICGYSREELLQLDRWALTPEEYLDEEHRQIGLLEKQGHLGPYERECLGKDGIRTPVRMNGVLIHDRQGEPFVWSVIEDISERKYIDTRLRMAASVFDAAREGIAITDPSGRIIDVNPAFTTITGYSWDEVMGKNPNILASGKHDQDFYQAMWSSLLIDGEWSGEIINRRKSGEIYTEHLNIVAVHDDHGEVRQYIGIFSDISQLKEQEQHLQHIAHHDALTSLPNRLLLTSRLTRAIEQARQTEQVLAILYLDLDGFKPVNDNHGHEVGDLVLVEVAHRLSQCLRVHDTVARIGGDEFVILLVGISGMDECESTASRLLDAISKPFLFDNWVLNLTASIGICLHQDGEQSEADILLRYADQAMYLAKNGGRNQYVFYDSLSQTGQIGSDQTLHDLRRALNEDQITVHYQPILDLATGRVVKAEALVRWHHPERGMVPPAEFIPLAENGGLIHEVGDLVFKQAAHTARIWNNMDSSHNDGPLRISVNRSPRQFFHRNGVNTWLRFLKEQDIPGELLGVEITEGLLLDDWPDVHRQIKQLHDIGVDISLDDFGTGYSALSYLKKFNIDYLKIDRSFIKHVVEDPDYQAIVKSIIAIANQLDIKTIGEGVETQEQLEWLRTAGCDLIQGFFYARPMPEDEFLEFVATRMQ